MIEVLLKNPYFITLGALSSIIICLSIFKKLIKVVIFTIVLFVAISLYLIRSDKSPNELIKNSKASVKKIQKNIKLIEKKSVSNIKKIEKKIPKGIKKTVKKIIPESQNDFERITNKQERALEKLKTELKKHKNILNP